jgi:hemoglobin
MYCTFIKMGEEKRDIRFREDIAKVVAAFYQRAIQDTEIGYIFTDVAKLNLERHIPVICDFWETVLLGNMVYRGGVVGKHIQLHRKSELRPEHFERWLSIWHTVVDSTHAGEKAEEMKKRASMMAELMKHKINYFDNNPSALV